MTVEDELVALRNEDGLINPRTALQWASDNRDSQLAGRLEWDDTKAAEEYRLGQVRRLIAVYVRTEDGNRGTISLIQDRRRDGGYREVEMVLSSTEMRAIALREALRELRRFEQRYRHLRELGAVFAAAAVIEPPADTAAAA